MPRRRRTNKSAEAREERAHARREAIRLARQELADEIESHECFIRELRSEIAPGDLFVSRGYYGHLLTYQIISLEVKAPDPELIHTRKLPNVKVMVNYYFSREDWDHAIRRSYPLDSFLFKPVHGNTYRVKAVRPIKYYGKSDKFNKPNR